MANTNVNATKPKHQPQQQSNNKLHKKQQNNKQQATTSNKQQTSKQLTNEPQQTTNLGTACTAYLVAIEGSLVEIMKQYVMTDQESEESRELLADFGSALNSYTSLGTALEPTLLHQAILFAHRHSTRIQRNALQKGDARVMWDDEQKNGAGLEPPFVHFLLNLLINHVDLGATNQHNMTALMIAISMQKHNLANRLLLHHGHHCDLASPALGIAVTNQNLQVCFSSQSRAQPTSNQQRNQLT